MQQTEGSSGITEGVKHRCPSCIQEAFPIKDHRHCTLGIDVGETFVIFLRLGLTQAIDAETLVSRREYPIF